MNITERMAVEMISFTDDPLRDFNRYEMEQFLYEQSRPICDECGEHIMDEYYWEFHGLKFCERCVEDHKVRIDDI